MSFKIFLQTKLISVFILVFSFSYNIKAEINISLNPQDWKPLKFSSIPPNKISGNSKELIIEVNKSSSPLIYKLQQSTKLKSIFVKGAVVEGSLNLNGKTQGLFKNKKSLTDDYVLRFGIVFSGKNKKPMLPEFLLASWIKEMFSLAPKGVGIDKIYFLKVADTPNQIGDKRYHPLSNFLFEEVVSFAKSGNFSINKDFEIEQDVLGFWISANGEGTSSQFKTKLTQITINPAKK